MKIGGPDGQVRGVYSSSTTDSRRTRVSAIFFRLIFAFLLVFSAGTALAQQSQTIESIRVIGNRRIPKETILARMFTHPGDTYDSVSIERDFNSLWNTGYFEDLRIEREDTEKGIILDVFVRERPTIREINYKGNSVSTSDILDRFKRRIGLSVKASTTRPRSYARKTCLGTAGRTWTPVRHDQARRQNYSAGLGANQLQHQGRPDGQSR